jgi:hypothetical protein
MEKYIKNNSHKTSEQLTKSVKEIKDFVKSRDSPSSLKMYSQTEDLLKKANDILTMEAYDIMAEVNVNFPDNY